MADEQQDAGYNPAKDLDGDGKVTKAERRRYAAGERKSGSDKPVKTADEVAQEFGFKLAFINSDPDLKRMFSAFMADYTRLKGQIAPERFELMMDQWADAKGFTVTEIADRQMELEQPDDYRQVIASDVSTLRDAAAGMGASLDDAQLEAFVERARRMGLNAAQQRDALVEYVTATGGDFAGQAGTVQDELAKWGAANGVRMSPNMVDGYVRRILSGDTTIDEVKSDIRKTYMAGAFPAWSDKIMAGMDIADIAAPYKATMAQLLEVDETAIGFDDPLLAAGLQATDKDGKPAVLPLYEYQNMVRKDPRWQQTDNAYATYANVAQGILRTFGFA